MEPRGLRGVLLPLGLVAGLAWLALSAVFGERGVMAWLHLRREAAALERQVAEARRENAVLRAEVRALARDPEAVERAAAEELGVAAPGTRVVPLR